MKLTSPADIKQRNGDDYHYTRLHSPTVKFSLQCRIEAISRGISLLAPGPIQRLLDLGSADGLLAQGILAANSSIEWAAALDSDPRSLSYNPFPAVGGDCRALPFASDSFDVVAAAALIEHLPDPQPFLAECHRVLRPGGALFITSPAPFFEWAATRIGYLKDSGHLHRYNLVQLGQLCSQAGFKAVMSEKFMVSPFHIPGEHAAEAFFRRLGLSFMMLNQIVGGIK